MENVVLFHTEEFSFEKAKDDDGKETVIISGNAQPLSEDSRNGVRYRPDSVKKAAKSLMGVAFLFNHDSSRSLGHVVDQGLTDSHLTYSADVDPEEKEYIRKVERGDIKHVSVGCMVENVEWNEEENIYICDVKEYVELSAVTVPGFANTSANKEGAIFLAEKLGDEKVVDKLKSMAKESKDDTESEEDMSCDKTIGKNIKGDANGGAGTLGKAGEEASDDEDDEEEASDDDDDDEEVKDDDDDEASDDDDDDKDEGAEGDEPASEETPEGSEDTETDTPEEGKEDLNSETDDEDEPTTDERVEALENKNNELEGMVDELTNRIAILESKVDAMNDEESSEGAEGDEPKEEAEDLEPNKEEEFNSGKEKPAPTKESLAAKEKALFGDSKKGEDIDMDKVSMKNKSY